MVLKTMFPGCGVRASLMLFLHFNDLSDPPFYAGDSTQIVLFCFVLIYVYCFENILVSKNVAFPV